MNYSFSMEESKRRKCLTLREKVEVIERKRNGEKTMILAADYNCGRTQINDIMRKADSYLEKWQAGVSGDERYLKKRKTGYEELNRQVWDWYCTARQDNTPVSGTMIQAKAKELAQVLGHSTFSASNGWLQSFQRRHHIKYAPNNAEADVCQDFLNEFAQLVPPAGRDYTPDNAPREEPRDPAQDTVQEWTQRLPLICRGYSPEDIFTAGETTLVYRALPRMALAVRGDTCAGGKYAKERLTVLLAVSATGEKLRPLVIGKYDNPRCFKNVRKEQLPVAYHANRKAWMTSAIFQEWLHTLNFFMKCQSRHVLLLIDSCHVHPEVHLTNVKVQFLPSVAPSQLHPLHAGIIQAAKHKYRKALLRHLLFKQDQPDYRCELARRVTVMDAVLWLDLAWSAVRPGTVQRCFAKCGFRVVARDPTEDAEDAEPDLDPYLQGSTLADFAEFDNHLETAGQVGDKWEEVVPAAARADKPDDSGSEDEAEAAPLITMAECGRELSRMKEFAVATNRTKFLYYISLAQAELENEVQPPMHAFIKREPMFDPPEHEESPENIKQEPQFDITQHDMKEEMIFKYEPQIDINEQESSENDMNNVQYH